MKKMITKKLIHIVIIVILSSLTLNLFIQFINTLNNTNHKSQVLFIQIDNTLAKNTQELEEVKTEYSQICLHYADSVAYILNENNSIIYNIDELQKISDFIEVDEIHIFDKQGAIIAGTNPEYYGLTMDSGEQISFFMPMLEDKTLRLCQDVTPNTAEGKQMQYAAVWSTNGNYIVQIGMEPVRVLEATEKNQLSHIFSLITTDTGSCLYAIDEETGEILGSTDSTKLGLNVSDIGLSIDDLLHKTTGFHSRINDEFSYCITHHTDSVLILRTCTAASLYKGFGKSTMLVAIYLLIIAVFMVYTTTQYLNKHIVKAIKNINNQLTDITDGDLDQTIDVHTTPEFQELSTHINSMIESILDSTNKMSYVLDQAELPIAVYEYSKKMSRVRATMETSNILSLSQEETDRILSDSALFEQELENLRAHPVNDFENTFTLNKRETKYIKMESFQKDDNILGMLIDMTDTVIKHRQVEKERDLDTLTGLYNRRALESKLDNFFESPDTLSHSALIMLDADGLKQINDTYGHEAGDAYLCEIASILTSLSPDNSLIARQGGDEFVLFYYGYDNDDDLIEQINLLKANQDSHTFKISHDVTAPIRFSVGYSLCYGKGNDYPTILREADQKMYTEKKLRKSIL